MIQKKIAVACLLFCATLPSVFAKTFDFDENKFIYGTLEFKVYKGDKDLYALAREYDVAYDVLMAANPGLESGEYKLGSVIVLPTMFMIPNVKHQGMVINLPERRLYLFRPKEKKLDIFLLALVELAGKHHLGNIK